jgi:hypothetical protein
MASWSCESALAPGDGYFPIDSLLDQQIGVLLKRNAALHKLTTLGSESTPVDITPADEQEWNDQLDVFRDLNMINRYTDSNAYLVQDNLPDERSNLTVRSVTLRNDLDESHQGEIRVKYLRIFYEGAHRNIRRLEARYAESNSMYTNDRYLTMIFEDVYSKSLLTEYTIEGGQKIVLGDTVSYKIEARIFYTNDRNGKKEAN